jgi:dihydropteroate synthase
MVHANWRCGRFEFNLKRPLLMGIVNVTPDSFSDGGQHPSASQAIDHAWRLVNSGAQIIDIGGESTRPGADPVSVQTELERVLPVVEALKDCGAAISVDTCKPQVMQAALASGADMINDIMGMTDAQARQVVASHPDCGVCIMHMQGEPRTMQINPHYDDVVQEVLDMLMSQAFALETAGVSRERISIDPGFGFGKTLDQNLELMRALPRFCESGYPVLLGVSRKSMIGAITGRPVDQRIAGSLAAALAGIARGARVVRVHDVAEMLDAIKVWQAVEQW